MKEGVWRMEDGVVGVGERHQPDPQEAEVRPGALGQSRDQADANWIVIKGLLRRS
jgi:hypothetical protein